MFVSSFPVAQAYLFGFPKAHGEFERPWLGQQRRAENLRISLHCCQVYHR